MLSRFTKCLLVFAAFAFGALRETESRIRLVNNGYEGVVVVIKDSVAEDRSLINRIKEEFTDASQLLFKATKHRAYFRNITIVVPKTWTKLQRYKRIPAVNVFTEHIRIDKINKVYNERPYVRGNMECGKPGWYMHLTPNFLKQKGETGFGNHENAIVHEWGHLRWGLFDEYPSITHPNANKPFQKINFYNEDGSWKPVTCSRATHGTAYDGKCRTSQLCNLKSITLPPSCNFCPDRTQPGVKSSFMATQWLQTMDSFCEEDADTTDASIRHNSRAPNLQNKVCNGQSAWEVMLQHEDFKNGDQLSPTTNTYPSYEVVKEIGRIRIFVFDVSGSMAQEKIVHQRHAALLAIDALVETGSWLGIVSFSDKANILAQLTEIKDTSTVTSKRNARKDLKACVPSLAAGGTQIYKGLDLAVKVIEGSKFLTTAGTEIILFSDGQSDPYLHIIPDLQQKGVIVHTIAITNAADQGMTQLAQETGGRSFTYLETETVSLADVLGQVIATGSSDNTAVEKVFSKSYDISSVSDATGRFTIDQGLGNMTELAILLTTVDGVFVSVDVTGPNNETYHIDDTTDMLTLKIPETAEVGNYYFQITTSSVKVIPMTVSVTSQPASEDDDVLRVTSRMSITTLDFQSSEEMKVYASTEKGGIPVLNANVTATLAADTGFMPIEIVMLDSGTGADVIAMDGVYSAYLLKKYFTWNSGRYNVKINIVGDGNAFTYTTDVDMGGKAVPIPGEVEEIEFEVMKLEEFQRQSLPGVIKVVNYISSPPDTTPPAKITDLNVANIRNSIELYGEQSITYTLIWTAVGDDMDVGQASRYDMRMDRDNINLRKQFSSTQFVPFNFTTPKQAGQHERINLTLTLDDCNGTCFLALRAQDANDLFSEISNIVNVDVNFFYEPEEKFIQTTEAVSDDISTQADIEMIIGIVIGTVAATAISVVVVACICKKRSTYQVTRGKHDVYEVESGQQKPCKAAQDEDISFIKNEKKEDISVGAEIPLVHMKMIDDA